MEKLPTCHSIRVKDNGAFCSCGRARETPDTRDARNWANIHFTSNVFGILTDEKLNP